VSLPARSEEVDAAPADLDKQRSRKSSSHYYSTRWRDEIPARFHEGVPPRALELASELGRRANNDTGHCFRTIATLAEATGRSPRTVSSAIADLERNGLIRHKRDGRKRIDFWILPLPAEKRHWLRKPGGGAPDDAQRGAGVEEVVVDVDRSGTDAQPIIGEQLALLPEAATVADQIGKSCRLRPAAVADQIGKSSAEIGNSCRSDRQIVPPHSNYPSNSSRTTPSTAPYVRTPAEEDRRGEAVAAMEACGLNRVEELLGYAKPERILASCEWFGKQRGAGTGLLASTIMDGGRAPVEAPIGACTLTTDLDEAWASVRPALRQLVGDVTFNLQLAPLHPHERTDAGWVLGCPAGQVAWKARYRRVLEQAAGQPVRLVACARSGDEGTDSEHFMLEGIDGGRAG
jgi:DNA-binding transcriptional ArsR family regulator